MRLPLDRVLTASWWPSNGPDAIGFISETDDGLHLGCFDCRTASLEVLGPIKSPKPHFTRDRQFYTGLAIHPYKDLALIGAREGPSNSYQEEHGSAERVAQLNLNNREISLLVDPFVGHGNSFERCHSDWRWVEPAEPIPLTLHDELLSSSESVSCNEPHDTEVVGHDAGDLAILAIKALVSEPDNVQQLRPEALRAVDASLRYAYRQELVDWLEEVSAHITTNLQRIRDTFGPDQKRWPPSCSGLAAFARGLNLAMAGHSNEIDWAGDRKA